MYDKDGYYKKFDLKEFISDQQKIVCSYLIGEAMKKGEGK